MPYFFESKSRFSVGFKEFYYNLKEYNQRDNDAMLSPMLAVVIGKKRCLEISDYRRGRVVWSADGDRLSAYFKLLR